MKKLLGLLMVLAVAMPASAEILRNFELTGDVQVLASDVRHNSAAQAFTTGTNLRVLAGGSFDVAENVRANLMFQYLNSWGSGPALNTDSTVGTVGKSANDYLDDIRVVEANVEMKEIFGWLDVKLGRQFYGDEDSTVMYIGPRYYNAEVNAANAYNYATSLDAVKLSYANDFVNANVIAGEVETYPATGTELIENGDKHAMYGVDAKFRITDEFSAQVYGYNFKSLFNEDNFGFYGGKVTFAPEAFLVSAEYARNFEGDRVLKESHDNPYMVKADAKLFLDAVTPRVAFFYSKYFQGFGNYRPGLLVGDLYNNTVSGQFEGGLRLYNVGVDYKYEKWTFALDGFAFQDRTAQHAATLEADLVVKYAYNDNIELFAGAGYAKYKENLKNEFGTDNTKGQVGVLVRL